MFKKIIAFITLLIIIIPLIYTLVLSFTPDKAIIQNSNNFSYTLVNYISVLSNSLILKSLFLSLATSISTTILRSIVIFLASFAYTFTNVKFKKPIYILLIATMFIPPDILLIQNYQTISNLHLLNTFFAIISTSIFGPTQLLLQQQFFTTLPKEYFQMSKIDGCTDFQVIKHVLLPLSTPILTIISLQTFINVFNSYLWPLLVTNTNDFRTLQVLLTMLDFSDTLKFGSLSSSVVIGSILTIILLLLSKKTMIKHIGRYQLLS